jgi:hypothetical protein
MFQQDFAGGAKWLLDEVGGQPAGSCWWAWLARRSRLAGLEGTVGRDRSANSHGEPAMTPNVRPRLSFPKFRRPLRRSSFDSGPAPRLRAPGPSQALLPGRQVRREPPLRDIVPTEVDAWPCRQRSRDLAAGLGHSFVLTNAEGNGADKHAAIEAPFDTTSQIVNMFGPGTRASYCASPVWKRRRFTLGVFRFQAQSVRTSTAPRYSCRTWGTQNRITESVTP